MLLCIEKKNMAIQTANTHCSIVVIVGQFQLTDIAFQILLLVLKYCILK